MIYKKYIFIVALFFGCTLNFAQSAWGSEVFLTVNEKPLRYVLDEIRNQTNINLIFNDDIIDEKKVTCDLKVTAEEAMNYVLSETGFSFKKFNNNVAVIFPKTPEPKKTKAVVRNKDFKPRFLPKNEEVIKPILLSDLQLAYPQDAIKKRIEGEVLARILVSKSGDVTEAKVEKSSGHEILDTATINYVRKLKFLPAEYNGKYHKVWTSMLVKYNFE